MIERKKLQYQGWGIVGDPQDGILVSGPSGPSIEVYGYNEGDYWRNGEFLGPDCYGIVPVYVDADGELFPPDAQPYPHLS